MKRNGIDFNASVVIDRTAFLDQAARDLMNLVLKTASDKQTTTGEKGFREISIFNDSMVL